jgi:hypothetical protein
MERQFPARDKGGGQGQYCRQLDSDTSDTLTALGSLTARFAWSPAAQASFDALKLALSSAPVLRTFDPARRAVLTTDARMSPSRRS